MTFDSLHAFWTMGGQGRYVWSAYGVAFVVLAWNLAMPVLQKRRLKRAQARRARFEAKP